MLFRSGGGTRLGNDVDADVLTLADLQKLVDGEGGDVVARVVDIGGVLGGVVVERGLTELDDGAGAQVGAANTDGDEDIAGLLDLFGRDLDAGELLFIVIHGEGRPAEEVVPCSRAGGQKLVGDVHLGLNVGQLLGGDEGRKIIGIETNRHGEYLPFKIIDVSIIHHLERFFNRFEKFCPPRRENLWFRTIFWEKGLKNLSVRSIIVFWVNIFSIR